MTRSPWLLLRGIKSILRCDEAEVIAGIAGYVVGQSRGLSVLSATIERSKGTPFPPAVAVFGAVRSYFQVRSVDCFDGALWIAKFDNERNALAVLPALVPEIAWTEIEFGRGPDIGAFRFSPDAVESLRRLTRLARRLHSRYPFYQVLRVLELVGFYARYLRILQSGRFAMVAVSNHSNPHGIAFALAARKLGIPVTLVTHGMPIRPVARMSYELAVVHCEAARQTYEADGCKLGQVLVHGRSDSHEPMRRGALPSAVRVGVFLCKDVKEERLKSLVNQLLSDSRVSSVMIRAHPNNFWRGLAAWAASHSDGRLRLSNGNSVAADLEVADVVFAGNSSVLIDAVLAGRPAGYVSGLDCGPHDLHGFVAEGLIFLTDEDHPFDPGRMLAFYERPEWDRVLRDFANVDEDETQVAAQLGNALRTLVAASRRRTGVPVEAGNAYPVTT
jgi:hypothetical protein